MNTLTTKQKEQICDLYKEGYNGPKIKTILGFNIKTIYAILNKSNLVKPINEAKTIFCINKNYFDEITTNRQAYWLGFIAGDGSVKNNYIILNIHKKDRVILEQFIIDTNSNYKIYEYKNIVNLTVACKHMVESLAKFNIVERKTKTFSIPTNIPNHLLNSFILGFFDADGCFSIDKTRGLRFSLIGTISAVEEIQNILINKCGVNKNKLQNHHSTEFVKYLVYSGDKQLIKIFKYMYDNNDFYLPRKFNKANNYFNSLL